jgi:hypothetical protein
MDDAAVVCDAAREVLSDVGPPPLRDLLETYLNEATVTPGVVTLMSARAAGGPDASADLDRRVAGVQLIHSGLSLTRSIVRSPPWETEGASEADTDLLVANILVARGFYLLAHTDAADTAVKTVRSFAREETARETDPDAGAGPDALEVDVLELAIAAGASAGGISPPPRSRALAIDLADGLADNDGVLPEGADAALERLIADDGQTSATPDGMEASSAADF